MALHLSIIPCNGKWQISARSEIQTKKLKSNPKSGNFLPWSSAVWVLSYVNDLPEFEYIYIERGMICNPYNVAIFSGNWQGWRWLNSRESFSLQYDTYLGTYIVNFSVDRRSSLSRWWPDDNRGLPTRFIILLLLGMYSLPSAAPHQLPFPSCTANQLHLGGKVPSSLLSSPVRSSIAT